jgi:hypothetical protein
MKWLPILGLGLMLPNLLQGAEPTPEEIFQQRLLPIFKSPNPSSCTQCHLASVDLKDYLHPDHEKSFRSLRDQGLIDLKNPDQSKILQLIQMGGSDHSPTNAVHAKTRKLEFEAFAAWIKACVADAKLRETPKLGAAELAKPEKPNEVIRHARKDQLLDSFEQNVWAWRFRCMNCHIEGTPQNTQLRKKFGDRVSWIKSDSASTMHYLIESKLIDLKNPEQSLLLLKPLGTKPHEGGIKFVLGDQGYKGFRTWIEDVLAIRNQKYLQASDLPKIEKSPVKFGTDFWFKLTMLPESVGDKLLQVRIFAWDEKKNAWESEPIATSDRLANSKLRIWQHNLTLLAPANSDRAKAWKANSPAPANGRYLVRVYVDGSSKLSENWNADLGEKDYLGSLEFETKWKEGYGGMVVVSLGQMKK